MTEKLEFLRQMPSLFISHGAPNMVISDLSARTFLESLATRLPRPSAIIVTSAHFEHKGVAVVTDPKPGMIYDFSGFEAELYNMVYPAHGAPELAEQVFSILEAKGLHPARISKRGFDHGTWTPLVLVFPKADIPVLQISIDPSKDALYHFKLGQALSSLREEGVLIIGSGHITHNLRGFFHHGRDPQFDAMLVKASDAFVAWIQRKVVTGEIEDLLNWETTAPFAKENHPEAEHLMPFFVALGAAGQNPTGQRLHHSVERGFFAYDHYAFFPQQLP